MLDNIYIELIINFYKTYNRWPNYYDEQIILTSITNFKENINIIPKLYEPVFTKFHFYQIGLSKKDINQKVGLLIDFFDKFNKWPNENEEYKGINIGEISYNIKFCNLPIKFRDKCYLSKFAFFSGVNNHKKILILLKYYCNYKTWPKKEVVFENIKIGEFALSIKKKKVSICPEDRIFLSSLDFFD